MGGAMKTPGQKPADRQDEFNTKMVDYYQAKRDVLKVMSNPGSSMDDVINAKGNLDKAWKSFKAFVMKNTDVIFDDLCDEDGWNQLGDEHKKEVREAFTNNTWHLENPPYGASFGSGEYMGAAYMTTKAGGKEYRIELRLGCGGDFNFILEKPAKIELDSVPKKQ